MQRESMQRESMQRESMQRETLNTRCLQTLNSTWRPTKFQKLSITFVAAAAAAAMDAEVETAGVAGNRGWRLGMCTGKRGVRQARASKS